MGLRILAGGACGPDLTCPGIWEHTEPGDVIVVGQLLDPSPVPLGSDEVAVRLPRRIIDEVAAT